MSTDIVSFYAEYEKMNSVTTWQIKEGLERKNMKCLGKAKMAIAKTQGSTSKQIPTGIDSRITVLHKLWHFMCIHDECLINRSGIRAIENDTLCQPQMHMCTYIQMWTHRHVNNTHNRKCKRRKFKFSLKDNKNKNK